MLGGGEFLIGLIVYFLFFSLFFVCIHGEDQSAHPLTLVGAFFAYSRNKNTLSRFYASMAQFPLCFKHNENLKARDQHAHPRSLISGFDVRQRGNV